VDEKVEYQRDQDKSQNEFREAIADHPQANFFPVGFSLESFNLQKMEIRKAATPTNTF
jgi:hypothetical protein